MLWATCMNKWTTSLLGLHFFNRARYIEYIMLWINMYNNTQYDADYLDYLEYAIKKAFYIMNKWTWIYLRLHNAYDMLDAMHCTTIFLFPTECTIGVTFSMGKRWLLALSRCALSMKPFTHTHFRGARMNAQTTQIKVYHWCTEDLLFFWVSWSRRRCSAWISTPCAWIYFCAWAG